MKLDIERQRDAMERVKLHRDCAEYHVSMSRVEFARVNRLIRAWHLCPLEAEGEPCCMRPEGCDYINKQTKEGI